MGKNFTDLTDDRAQIRADRAAAAEARLKKAGWKTSKEEEETGYFAAAIAGGQTRRIR